MDPPTIQAVEACGDLSPVFDGLCELSILRKTAPASSADCSECGERCRVDFILDKSGAQQGYVHCRHCGIAKVRLGALQCWEIDTNAFLAVIFPSVKAPVQERVPGQLWQVGNTKWADRSREVWFARRCRRDSAGACLRELERRPKAIVFAPTESGASRLRESIENLVVALESVLSLEVGEVRIDEEHVESLLIDAGLAGSAPRTARTKRRGSRATKIELLEKEMIKHLRAARDHAYDSLARTGQAALLPRPMRKDLAALTGLKRYDVTKCFQDAQARELNVYWDVAMDLDQIMAWKGPIERGRST